MLAAATLAPAWAAAQAGDAAAIALSASPAPWPVRGQGTMRFLGFPVYDATLAAPAGFDPQAWAASPLELTLRYHRGLRGEAIAERSLDEMRRGGPIAEPTAAAWLAFMRAAFPDVGAGDRIVGRWWPDSGRAAFQVNGGAWRELADPAFGPRFFGIWLAPHSSQPALRERLLGQR